MTREEARRWSQAFTVLSLERFACLFGDLGLPRALAQEPEGVIGCARAFLENDPPPQGAAEAVDRAFAAIAAAYDRQTMAALRTWCARWIVDDVLGSRLFAWEQLFGRLCALVSDDGATIPSPLRPGASDRLCSCVTKQLRDEGLAASRARLAAAVARQPESSWERRLDESVRRSAGDPGKSLGVIEMAQETIIQVLRRRRTFAAARCVDTQLSGEEAQSVAAWARSQAEGIGIPVWLAEPPTGPPAGPE
jgi:hypothetical protein